MPDTVIIVMVVGGILVAFLITILIPRLVKGAKKQLKQPVRGTLTVASVTQAPYDASYSNYALQGVISGPGIQPTPVVKKGIASVAKWPHTGRTLPVLFEASNPTIFNILWDEVADGATLGAQAAQLMAQQMAQGGSPLAAMGVLDLAQAGVAGATSVTVNGQPVDPSLLGGAIPGANILTAGLTGTGKVTDVTQIGSDPGTLGTYRVQLLITPDQPGLVQYQAYFNIGFRMESGRKRDFICRIGAELPVRFDAANPQLVTVDPTRLPQGL